MICAIIYKLTLSKVADTRLMVDRMTGEIYYVKNVIKRNASNSRSAHLSTNINEVDIEELVEERDAQPRFH